MQIVVVHRQDPMEAQEVLGIDLACAELTNVVTPSLRARDRPRIRRLAQVVVMRARRIDQQLFCPSLALRDGTENPLGCRRSADIAHANEQDADLVLRGRFPVEGHRAAKRLSLDGRLHAEHRFFELVQAVA